MHIFSHIYNLYIIKLSFLYDSWVLGHASPCRDFFFFKFTHVFLYILGFFCFTSYTWIWSICTHFCVWSERRIQLLLFLPTIEMSQHFFFSGSSHPHRFAVPPLSFSEFPYAFGPQLGLGSALLSSLSPPWICSLVSRLCSSKTCPSGYILSIPTARANFSKYGLAMPLPHKKANVYLQRKRAKLSSVHRTFLFNYCSMSRSLP